MYVGGNVWVMWGRLLPDVVLVFFWSPSSSPSSPSAMSCCVLVWYLAINGGSFTEHISLALGLLSGSF